MLLNWMHRAAAGRRARTTVLALTAAAVLACTLWLVVQGGTPANEDWRGGYRPQSVGGCALALGLAVGGLTFFGSIPLAGYAAFSAGVFLVMAACGP